MKRLLIALLGALCVVGVGAQSFGGGVSVFVPTDMFEGQTGSVSIETALETSLGLGGVFSLPIGFAFNQVYGLSPDGIASSGPWFYADSFAPYAMLLARLPAGPVFFEVFGGGLMNWNISLRPISDTIANDLVAAGYIGNPGDRAGLSDLRIDSPLGFGYLAGAAVGVTFGQISIKADVTYRHAVHDLELRAEYFTDASTSGSFDSSQVSALDDLRVVMQGIAFGISGSFAP